MQNVAAPLAMTSENNPKTAGMTTKVVKGSLWTLAGQIAPLAFSMAAPTWFATAVISLRCPGSKASAPSRSVRLMTPTHRDAPPGAA